MAYHNDPFFGGGSLAPFGGGAFLRLRLLRFRLHRSQAEPPAGDRSALLRSSTPLASEGAPAQQQSTTKMVPEKPRRKSGKMMHQALRKSLRVMKDGAWQALVGGALAAMISKAFTTTVSFVEIKM